MRLRTWSITQPNLVGPNFVRPCSGHAKGQKRQEYAGRRTCSRGDRDALGSGLAVTEFAPQDTRQLWRWVSEKLVEGSLDMSKTRIMRPASDIRPARRSLMELTAAASRAIDDALLVTSNARN